MARTIEEICYNLPTLEAAVYIPARGNIRKSPDTPLTNSTYTLLMMTIYSDTVPGEVGSVAGAE